MGKEVWFGVDGILPICGMVGEKEEGGRGKVMSKQQPRKNEDLADNLVRK